MIGLAFFVFKRPEYTKKVIECIRKNKFEKIYIFQDGLVNEADRPQWEEVSNLIRNIDFAETEIHISNRNKGLAKSILDGMNYVFERHNEAIALEDDIELADGFKSIMEAMFEKYKYDKKVMSICGGGFGAIIPKEYKYDAYFSYRMSSYGFGTWKDRWTGFERDPRMLETIYLDEKKRKMFQYAGNDLEAMIFMSLQGKCHTWAAYWNLHQICHEAYHLIPVESYILDMESPIGGGTNTVSGTERYVEKMSGKIKEAYALPDEVFINEDIAEDIKSLMSISNDKMQRYFDILCAWMRLYQNGKSIIKYFLDKDIKKIYIYGIGNIAEFISKDIENDVKIIAYIVENRRENYEYNDRKVYDMRDGKKLENIPIVITPSYDKHLIMHLFAKAQIKNEIILIEDILKYAFDTDK